MHVSIISVDEAIRFRDESYVRGTSQRFLASPSFNRVASAATLFLTLARLHYSPINAVYSVPGAAENVTSPERKNIVQ